MSAPGTRNSKPGTDKVRKLVPALLTWFSANARDLPWRRTRDPYAIWVSEIMLQQTQVKTVIPYWERWLRELPTIESVVKSSPAKLHKLWEGMGYYTRVRNLQKAAQQIIATGRRRVDESQTEIGNRQPATGNKSEPPHVGCYEFPRDFDDILALPGIGRYTAGAIASIAFDQPQPVLDGNVIRVLTRVFGITTDPREKKTNARLWLLAGELVDHASRITHHTAPCSHLNQSLMELGALICAPRLPQCEACPVNKLCVARKKNWQEQIPNLGKRETTTERRFVAFVVERDGEFLVRQRPAGVVNAQLWEFPNVEVGARVGNPQHFAASEAGLKVIGRKPFCTIKHSITRYRITLEAWRAQSGGVSSNYSKPAGRWFAPKQLHRRAFTAAHRRILHAAVGTE